MYLHAHGFPSTNLNLWWVSSALHFLNFKDKQDTYELIISGMDVVHDFRITDLMFFPPAPDTGLISPSEEKAACSSYQKSVIRFERTHTNI